jgi:hypothetical protein
MVTAFRESLARRVVLGPFSKSSDPAFVEVRRNPVPEVLRLANVDDLSLGVLVEVDPGR